jgi:hypothetical protein
MASYSVASSKHATLTAATVDTVTFTGSLQGVRITNAGASDIWYCLGSSDSDGPVPPDPAVNGSVDSSFRLPPGTADSFDMGGVFRLIANALVVKLISSGTPNYDVEGF